MGSKQKQEQVDTFFQKFLIIQLDTDTFTPSLSFQWSPKDAVQLVRDKKLYRTNSSDTLRPSEKDIDKDDLKILQFCYPESIETLKSLYNQSTQKEIINNFSFVLTDSYGSKTITYCKRIIRQTDPICFCTISKKPYFKLFDSIFNVVQEKFQTKAKFGIHSLLTSIVSHQVPKSSTTIEITTFPTSNSQSENFIFPFSKPRTLFDHIDYDIIYNMKPQHLVRLFESVLCESRVVLMSNSPTVVSNAILAISSLLYPLVWQHIFISILPNSLMPYVSAPIPFLVGILDSSLKSFYQQPTEQVYLYDLDKLDFTVDPNMKPLLPYHIRIYLESYLKKLKLDHATYNSDMDHQIRKPFYSVIYHLFQNYTDFMLKNGVSYTFYKDLFLDSSVGQVKKILENLCNSQMVEMFFRDKETEFSASGDLNCSFLNDAQENADEIIFYSTKTLNKYDCRICTESTISKQSLEISGSSSSSSSSFLQSQQQQYIIHKDCFKCKACGIPLFDLEKERYVIKKLNDGERIKTYCSDCRSKTLINKIKISSTQSKQKFYAFFKNDDAGVSHTFSNIRSVMNNSSSSQSTSTHNHSSNSSSGGHHNHSTPNMKHYPVFPVSGEIRDFKFNTTGANVHSLATKKKGPHPNDLGRKSASLTKLNNYSLIPSPPVAVPASNANSNSSTITTTNTNGQPITTFNIRLNQKTYPTITSTVTLPSTSVPEFSKPTSSNSSNSKQQQQQQSKNDRFKPPLPPTPDERVERAIEQIKKRNINVHTDNVDLQEQLYHQHPTTMSFSAASSPSSLSSSPQSHSPPSSVSSSPTIFKDIVDTPLLKQSNQYSRPLPCAPKPPSPSSLSPSPSFIGSTHSTASKRSHSLGDASENINNTTSTSFSKTTTNTSGVNAKTTSNDLEIIPSSKSFTNNYIPPKYSPRRANESNQSSNNPAAVKNSPREASPPTVQSNQQQNHRPLPVIPKAVSSSTTYYSKSIDIPTGKAKTPPSVSPRKKDLSPSSTTTTTPPVESTSTTTTTKSTTSNRPLPKPSNNSLKLNTHKSNNTNNNGKTMGSPRKQLLPTPNPTTSTSTSPSTSPSPLSSPESKSPRRLNRFCFNCKEELNCKVPLMMANNNYYHQHCFTCTKCNNTLQKDYLLYQNKLYHVSCAQDVIPTCSRCEDKILSGKYIEDFKRKAFHEHCFSCVKCNTSLVGAQGYQEYFLQYYCKSCGDSL
ncbi:hypothetical protein CYY_000368 [Polysphondylium violaceum]|uniref:UDENN domain-containing protein n=1 Tax=Polysphondylium violaceum TaxID=133409 RepID=A0A8J4Q421_9MYCE|nr:hypothetical protein CYY_000368 [Polysphondylium violaceum]